VLTVEVWNAMQAVLNTAQGQTKSASQERGSDIEPE
jgi:hypothetical protein